MDEYDGFGNTDVRAGEEFYNEICYTGGIYDQSTGLYYLNARYYDPKDGRFVSQDTYRGEPKDSKTWNLYAYCADDPVNCIDPTGHWTKYIHYTKTKEWAKSQKMSSKHADILASADTGTDKGVTNPALAWSRHFYGNFGKGADTRKWYYNYHYKKFVKIWKKKKGNYKKKALKQLGMGLHSAQDIYAHKDWSKRLTIHWAWLNGNKNKGVFDWPSY